MNPSDIGKLQILNDLIAQTIDALGQRSVGVGPFQGSGRFGVPSLGGLSHSPQFMGTQTGNSGWNTPFVTPYGVVQPGMSHSSMDPRLALLQQQIQSQIQNQLQGQLQQQPWGMSPFVGIDPYQGSGVFGGGLSHTSSVPWQSLYPLQSNVGFGGGFVPSMTPWQSSYGNHGMQSYGGGLSHTNVPGWQQQSVGAIGYPHSQYGIDPRWSMMSNPMQMSGGLSHSGIDPRLSMGLGMVPAFTTSMPGVSPLFR